MIDEKQSPNFALKTPQHFSFTALVIYLGRLRIYVSIFQNSTQHEKQSRNFIPDSFSKASTSNLYRGSIWKSNNSTTSVPEYSETFLLELLDNALEEGANW